MIHTKEAASDQSLGREAIEIVQEAISPDWLAKVIKGTSAVLFVLIALAFAI